MDLNLNGLISKLDNKYKKKCSLSKPNEDRMVITEKDIKNMSRYELNVLKVIGTVFVILKYKFIN